MPESGFDWLADTNHALEWVREKYGSGVADALQESGGDPIRFVQAAKAYEARFSTKIAATEGGGDLLGVSKAETIQAQVDYMNTSSGVWDGDQGDED